MAPDLAARSLSKAGAICLPIQINEDDPGVMMGCIVVTIDPLSEKGFTPFAIDRANLSTCLNDETLDHCFISYPFHADEMTIGVTTGI